MTSIDFLNKVHKNLDSQEYSLSYSPAKSKNYMLYCNGNFIGGLFDEELCFVYADSVSELLGQPEPVYRGYSSTAQHRMLVIPEEHWAKALKLLYAEKFDWSRLVYDITYTSIGAAVVEDFYDENVVFLRFCFEKELLKKNPLDRQGRILRMVYINQDLTNTGKYFSYGAEIQGGKDPWFGLELWFLTSFQGKPVWALNREHLAYLINYLSADLREKPSGSQKKTQADHLPTFMKTAKNRERIVKLLKKLQEK